MSAFVWVKTGPGVYGLKPLKGNPTIHYWVELSRANNLWWEQDGAERDGIVHGSHKTKKEAMIAVEIRLGLRDQYCKHCGQKIVRQS